ALVATGVAAAFVAVSMWSYLLNIVHTGHVLGRGFGRTDWETSPSLRGDLYTTLHVLYRTLDVSVLSHRLIYASAVLGAVVALVLTIRSHLAGRRGRSLLWAAATGVPFLAPLLMIATGAALAYVTARIHIPVHTSALFGPYEAG